MNACQFPTTSKGKKGRHLPIGQRAAGADLRCLQQMLGYARLNTTGIYTHVNIQKLIEVHRLTHPAKLPSSEIGLEKNPASQ